MSHWWVDLLFSGLAWGFAPIQEVCRFGATEWQYEMLWHLKAYEARKPKRTSSYCPWADGQATDGSGPPRKSPWKVRQIALWRQQIGGFRPELTWFLPHQTTDTRMLTVHAPCLYDAPHDA